MIIRWSIIFENGIEFRFFLLFYFDRGGDYITGEGDFGGWGIEDVVIEVWRGFFFVSCFFEDIVVFFMRNRLLVGTVILFLGTKFGLLFFVEGFTFIFWFLFLRRTFVFWFSLFFWIRLFSKSAFFLWFFFVTFRFWWLLFFEINENNILSICRCLFFLFWDI